MTGFEGTINNGEIRSILKSATVLVDECRVFFEDDEMRIRGTDPSGVGLVLIEVSDEAFDDTVFNPGEACFDLNEMMDMIKTVGTGEDVELVLEDRAMSIDTLDLSFTLSLIDPDTLKRDHNKPDLDLPAEVVFDASAFQRGIDAADLVADHVEFGIDEENSAFYMEAKGDVNRVILRKEKQDLVTLTTESVSSTYSIEYLKDICSAFPEDHNVTISLGEDYPVEISFDVIDDKATVTYFISPRLQPNT